MQITILGRQPKISLVELESLFGAEHITPIDNYAALINSSAPLPQEYLGGTMKSATVITRLKNTDANQAFSYIQDEIVAYTEEKVFEGKIQLGFSLYGYKVQKNWLLKKSLEVKKILKKAGRSVRIIENKAEALEAAQILYNKLTGPQGIELLIIKDGPDAILAQTTAVQDIDAYAMRDFERPKRDAFVGMLPPKLAQIMINFAVGSEFLSDSSKNPKEADHKIQDPNSKLYVLDPFCGTGVVLQEALLMGYNAYGTDISERMVDYTKENLQWLSSKFQIPSSKFQVEVGDATAHQWDFSKFQIPNSKLYIICETYLGKPLSQLPNAQTLDQIVNEANQIIENFLRNVAAHPNIKNMQQHGHNFRMCLAVPAWKTKNGFRRLKVLDSLEQLGYNRVSFAHAESKDLIYHREDQIVGRELVVLVKK